MNGGHDRRLVVIVGDAGPPIACAARPPVGADSGYTVWRATGALLHPDDLPDGHPMLRLVCLDCLLDTWPALGDGIMTALDSPTRAAERDEQGHWQPATD